MNKTEIKKAINKAVYEYVTTKYPDWIIDSSEGYGRIYFCDIHDHDNIIEYHQSRHDFCIYNWAKSELKMIVEDLEDFVRTTKSKYIYSL